jgi:hypothetical protein
VAEPAIVPEANPPIPFVTSHSRCSAATRSLQISGPNEISLFLTDVPLNDSFEGMERFDFLTVGVRVFRGAGIP